MSIKTIARGLVVACCAALGLHAWAAVGDPLTYSSVSLFGGGTGDGGNYTGLMLKIPSQDGLPNGSVVTLQKIVVGLRNGNHSKNADYLVVLDGANKYANATACVQGEADSNFGNARPLTFDGYSCDLTVGNAYECQFRDTADGTNKAQQLLMFSHASSDDVLRTTATTTFSMLYTVTAQVKSLPGAGDYVASVSEDCNFSDIAWDRDLNWDDATSESTLTLNITSGKTVTLDKDINVASISISGGTLAIAADATRTIAGAGTISSKVTTAAGSTLTTNGNIAMGDGQTQISGALNVDGGTLTLTTKQNGGLNNNVVTIASGATFKSNNNDMPYWDGSGRSTTIKVYGTLDFSNTRWTMAAGEKVIAYAGATLKGAGDGEGAIDPNGNTGVVLELSGTEGEVTCSAPIRGRSAAQILVPEGMTLNYSGVLGDSVGNNGNVLTKDGAGTMKITSNFNTSGGLKIAAGKVVVTDAVLRGGVQVLEGASVEIVNTAEAALTVPTIKDGTVGSVTLVSGAFDYGAQRKAIVLGETATIKVTTTTQETAAGTLTIPGAKEGKISVFDANGNELTVASVSEDGVITLQTNAPITANCNLSEKIAAGTLIVQGPTEGDPITVNINCPMPNTSLTVTGEVIFNFVEGSETSAGTITLESGAVVTVSGTINNAITVPNGATLKTTGDVASAGMITCAGTLDVLDGTLTLSAGSVGGTIYIRKGAKIATTATNALNNTIVLHNYGTLDISGANHQDINSAPACVYNLYAGSSIVGGESGKLVMTGGFSNTINIKSFDDAESNTVAFNVIYQTSGYGAAYSTTFQKDNADLDVTFKSFTNNGSVFVKGPNGLDIHVVKGNYNGGSSARTIKGKIVIDAGASLTAGCSDPFEYKSPVANFDIYGTLAVGANRATISAEGGHNVIKIHNGGRITGAGAEHQSNMKMLDVCSDQTISVDGNVMIEGPIWTRGVKVTFSLNEGATAANVTLNSGIVNNGSCEIGSGVTLTAPSTMTVPVGAVAKIVNGETVTYYSSANAAVAASSAEHPAIAIADFTNSTDGLVHANQVLVIPTGITVTATRDMIWWSENGKVVVEGTLNASCNTTLTNGSLELHEGAVVGGTGSLKVDSNKTIVVTGDASVANISILGSKTLTLDITAGKTLTVGNFTHTGSNKVEVPTGTLVVTANDAATGIVYEIAGDAALTHDLTALGQLIKVKAAEGATITITSSANPETTELQASEPVDGVVTYTVVEKPVGPTSWDTITAEDLPATFAGADLDAVKTWTASYAGDFSQEALEGLNVDAFLLDCAPDAVDTAKAAFKIISVENVGGEWIVKVAGNVGKGGKYGNGYVVIESVKEKLFPEAGDDADFFCAKLQISAPTAE